MLSTVNSLRYWICWVHTCVTVHIHSPHSSFIIEQCCIPRFLSSLLTENYATGSDVWVELQVSTSISILFICLLPSSVSINQNSRGDGYSSEGEPCSEFLWGFVRSHSVCHRGTALAGPITSVSATVSVCYVELRASKPQNFQRFSNVAPTPLNSCLNMFGSRTISRSRSLAEIWEEIFTDISKYIYLYLLWNLIFFFFIYLSLVHLSPS